MLIRLFTFVLSIMIHIGLVYSATDFEVSGRSFEEGSGQDQFVIEQGNSLEGLSTLGTADETVQAVDAQPLPTSRAQQKIEAVKAQEPVDEVDPIEEKVTDIPQDVDLQNVPTGELAEVVKEKKPEEVQPTQVEQVAAIEQIQQTAVEEKIAATITASGGDVSLRREYYGKMRRHIERFKVNPRSRRKGTVVVRLTIAPGGDVTKTIVSKSSGYPVLDRAAMRAVKRASPFPPLPVGIDSEALSVSIPFTFLVR